MGRIHLNPELRGSQRGFLTAEFPLIHFFPRWTATHHSQLGFVPAVMMAACVTATSYSSCLLQWIAFPDVFALLCHCWGKRTEQDQICTVRDRAIVAVILVHDSC